MGVKAVAVVKEHCGPTVALCGTLLGGEENAQGQMFGGTLPPIRGQLPSSRTYILLCSHQHATMFAVPAITCWYSARITAAQKHDQKWLFVNDCWWNFNHPHRASDVWFQSLSCPKIITQLVNLETWLHIREETYFLWLLDLLFDTCKGQRELPVKIIIKL